MDTGTYSFIYTPRTSRGEDNDYGVSMSCSGEADLDELLKLFTRFLAANGYPVDFDSELTFKKD